MKIKITFRAFDRECVEYFDPSVTIGEVSKTLNEFCNTYVLLSITESKTPDEMLEYHTIKRNRFQDLIVKADENTIAAYREQLQFHQAAIDNHDTVYFRIGSAALTTPNA